MCSAWADFFGSLGPRPLRLPRPAGVAAELGIRDPVSKFNFLDLPDDLLEARDQLKKGSVFLNGGLSWGDNYKVFGIPEPPVGLPGLDTIGSEVLE